MTGVLLLGSEQLERQAVMRQRLRAAGLPVLSSADADLAVVFQAMAEQAVTDNICSTMHAAAAARRCMTARGVR